MKTFTAIVVLFILALCVLNAAAPSHDMGIWLNGAPVDGVFETLAGLVLAGGGLLLAGVLLVAVAMLVALLFAGLGVAVVGLLAGACALVALIVSPLLLPLLIIGAVLWYGMARRERRERTGRFTPRADSADAAPHAKV